MNSFNKYKFKKPEFNGEILKEFDDCYIGYIINSNGKVPAKWSKTGESRCDRYNLEPIEKKWYEDENNFPSLICWKNYLESDKEEFFIAKGYNKKRNKFYTSNGSGLSLNKEGFDFRVVATKEELLSMQTKDTHKEDEARNLQNDYDKTITINDLKYKEVTSPKTGRVWLDRNIGAKQVATSIDDKESYGDYLNWDKAVELADSFEGWRLPTEKELLEESKDWSNNIDAFDSFLKLPSASFCGDNPDYVYDEGSSCNIWSSSIYTNTPAYKTSWYLYINSDIKDTETCTWYYYLSVRLIKDID